MSVLSSIKRFVAARLERLVRANVEKEIERLLPVLPQLLAFQASPPQDRQSFYDHTGDPAANTHFYASLRPRLQAAGIAMEDADIDLDDFRAWMRQFPDLCDFYKPLKSLHIEKCLEHYLAYRRLGLAKDRVYIDVAASDSPWADILARSGIPAYRMDLSYPQGIKGNQIGADVMDMKLPRAFAAGMSLQDAYQCMMGPADIGFVSQAAAVLNERGRYVIAPLYLEDVFYNTVSAYRMPGDTVVDEGARRVWRDDQHKKLPFARAYSPEAFAERIYRRIPPDMKGTVIYHRNLPEIMKHFPRQRLYCFYMFDCSKRQN